MRAWEVSHPWGTANLRLIERPDPRPGPGEVVVRMRAIALNFRDTRFVASGGYAGAGSDSPPLIPFSDGCGIVDAVGFGVTRVAVGDRVSTLFFPHWASGPQTLDKAAGALGSPGAPGAGRDLALLPDTAVSRVPDFLTDQEVATLPCAALTAWRAMFVDAHLGPGDAVVLQGTGGVSLFGLQFAQAAGYRTIVTSSSDEKLSRARALGATDLVNYRTTPAWSDAVRNATVGRGADFVLEVGGAGTFAESLKAVQMGGHVAVVGALTDAANPSAPPPPLPASMMIATTATVRGVYVGSREMFEAMCRAIALHAIRPVIDRVLPWTEAPRALDELVGGNHFGKIVLTFD